MISRISNPDYVLFTVLIVGSTFEAVPVFNTGDLVRVLERTKKPVRVIIFNEPEISYDIPDQDSFIIPVRAGFQDGGADFELLIRYSKEKDRITGIRHCRRDPRGY